MRVISTYSRVRSRSLHVKGLHKQSNGLVIRNWQHREMNRGPIVSGNEIVLYPRFFIRLFRPDKSSGTIPALLWMHGGGHLFGVPELDDPNNIAFVR